MSSRFGDIIREARKPESNKASDKENQIAGKPEDMPEETAVNLCIKVPKSLRQHWAAEAKRQGTTLTAVIVDALGARFGKPQE